MHTIYISHKTQEYLTQTFTKTLHHLWGLTKDITLKMWHDTMQWVNVMWSVKTRRMSQNAKLSFWSQFIATSELFPELFKFVSTTSTSKVIIKWCWVVLYCYTLVFFLFQAISQNVILRHPMGFPRLHQWLVVIPTSNMWHFSVTDHGVKHIVQYYTNITLSRAGL